MLGKRGPQRGLFEADTAYGAFVGRDSFYGWLASQRGQLFRDEAFAGLYVLDNGRPSVPPSLLAVALDAPGAGDAAGQPLAGWAEAHGYGRYVGPTSLKGTAEIDWGDANERRRFLGEIVADADRLPEQARAARAGLAVGSAAEATLLEAAGLLSRVLVQDVERRDDGPALKQGVAKDRLVSVHHPEMRHGRKSASKRFVGYDAAVAVDTDEPLITAVTVLAGNAPDAEGRWS
jgi:hypothetical protein